MADAFDVIMAAYPSTGPAEQDFDALVQLVKEKRVASEGVILVEHDADGQVRVTHTGDHLGRKGLGWGGGVGLVVGLFSPPLLASIVVGGAAGALVGKFAKHKLDSGIEKGSAASRSSPSTMVMMTAVPGASLPQWPRRASGSSRPPWRRRRASSARTARCCRSPTAASAGRWAARSTSQSLTG